MGTKLKVPVVKLEIPDWKADKLEVSTELMSPKIPTAVKEAPFDLSIAVDESANTEPTLTVKLAPVANTEAADKMLAARSIVIFFIIMR